MMTTGNCIYAVPRAPILKFVLLCLSCFPIWFLCLRLIVQYCKGLTTLSAEAMYWLRRTDSLSALCVSSP